MTTLSGKVTVYRDDAGEWRWRWVAGNGRTLADSGEGYKRRGPAIRGLVLVTGGSVDLAPRQDVGWLVRGQEQVRLEVVP